METTYPQFFKHAGRCIKRESDTIARQVDIPEPNQEEPLCFDRVTYPSKERLDEAVAKMQQGDQADYEAYLATFFQGAEKLRFKFNEYRQKKFDRQQKQSSISQ